MRQLRDRTFLRPGRSLSAALGDAVVRAIVECHRTQQPEEIVPDDGKDDGICSITAVKLGPSEFVVVLRDITKPRPQNQPIDLPVPGAEGMPLTRRQLAVLQLIIDGATDKEIAQRLGITVFTASKHVANILDRLRVASRTEAAAHALRLGVLPAG